jgi:predicted small lipoprotein YifL
MNRRTITLVPLAIAAAVALAACGKKEERPLPPSYN